MASSSSSSSSSSLAKVSSCKHEVFVSFRGEDTRNNFTSHLYSSLVQNGIKAFIDDDGLERGDEIALALKNAIERSKLSVIVFSKDYASSSWCLDELVHILQCRRKQDQIVLPVFYHVDPSDVRKQKGNYEACFAMHEERFRGNIGRGKIWREALEEAANLSGWNSNVIRSESEFVKKIFQDVLKKLNRTRTTDNFAGFVGIEKRFEKIKEMLCIDSLEALHIIGIWGTGGIGKTTLANIAFQCLYTEFEACSFVEGSNVKWELGSKKYNDSKNVFSDHKHLIGKKVLVVLDNVTDPEQLDIFFPEDANQFGLGSRVIVTTRDMLILRGKVNDTYKVEKLDFDEAIQLFCSTALRRMTHQENDLTNELLEKIVDYTKGIPLALKVLSSFLRGKRHENWEVELNKLKEFPNQNIMNILRMSYDGLDEMQKCIFLDVACFFKNALRNDVEIILEACFLRPKTGLDDLINKSLIYINVDNKLCTHDLIQQMAFSIVKSETELENRSRLWISHEACHILETDTRSSAIEGIFLDMSMISEAKFNSDAFQSMFKLRLLKIFYSDVRKTCHISINGDNCDLRCFPTSLRYLHWEAFPWKSFPRKIRPRNLVELNLRFSNVVKLWVGTKQLGNLIKIDLSHSKSLIELPDLSRASKLKHVYLEYCTSLQEVHNSLAYLDHLETLNLNGCSSLRKFPGLPRSIVCLVLSGTAIEKVPMCICSLQYLEILSFSGCQNLARIPTCSVMHRVKVLELPEVSRKKPLVYKNRSLEYETYKDRSSNASVSHFRKLLIREPSKEALCPELPLFCYDFGGQMNSVEIVSASSEVLLLDSLNTGQWFSHNLAIFNCLGFYGGGKTEDIVNVELQLHSKRIVSDQFRRACSIAADIGFCCPRNKIPKWFDHQRSGDTVEVLFKTRPEREILGFAVCAIYAGHTIGFIRDQYYSNRFNFMCEPTYTSVADSGAMNFMGNCFPGNPIIRCDSQRSKDISRASFRFWCKCALGNFGLWATVEKCGVKVLYGDIL